MSDYVRKTASIDLSPVKGLTVTTFIQFRTGGKIGTEEDQTNFGDDLTSALKLVESFLK